MKESIEELLEDCCKGNGNHIHKIDGEFTTPKQKILTRFAELEKKIDESKRKSVCAYCGTVLISESVENKINDVIEHMATCEKHPVPKLVEKISDLEAENKELFELRDMHHKKITELEEQVEQVEKAMQEIHSLTCLGEGAKCWDSFNKIRDYICKYLGYQHGGEDESIR